MTHSRATENGGRRQGVLTGGGRGLYAVQGQSACGFQGFFGFCSFSLIFLYLFLDLIISIVLSSNLLILSSACPTLPLNLSSNFFILIMYLLALFKYFHFTHTLFLTLFIYFF